MIARRGHVILDPGAAHPRARKANSLRVAPGRDGRPLTSFWRIWAQGDEVYVASRSATSSLKASLHSSEQWFVWIGSHRHGLARPLALPGGCWTHALEVRFLVGQNTLLPSREVKFKPSKPGLIIESPQGAKVILNVLYGKGATTHDTPLPAEMHGAVLLQLTLRNGTCVVVVARVREMSEQDHRELHSLRYELGIQVRSSRPRSTTVTSVELYRIDATLEGGNIIAVVPLGAEAVATSQAPLG